MRGNVITLTGPGAEPITLTEAKAHLRVDGTDEDGLITALIVAAREHVENHTARVLVARSMRSYFPGFPARMDLVAPLQSVASVKYLEDSAGTETTLATTNYVVDAYELPGVVTEAYSTTYPTTYDHPQAVRVAFTAGYVAPFTADTTTNVLTVSGRTYTDGDVVRLTNSGGALPTGLSAGTDYYVRDASGYTVKLAATSGGTAIDITGAGTGTHFVGEIPQPIRAAMLLLIGHLYANREAVNVGNIVTTVPLAVDALLAPYRVAGF